MDVLKDRNSEGVILRIAGFSVPADHLSHSEHTVLPAPADLHWSDAGSVACNCGM